MRAFFTNIKYVDATFIYQLTNVKGKITALYRESQCPFILAFLLYSWKNIWTGGIDLTNIFDGFMTNKCILFPSLAAKIMARTYQAATTAA